MPTKVGFVLHAYQPPTQDKAVRERVFRESYEPVIAFLERTPGAFLSIDIAKSVGEHWPKEFLGRIKKLYQAHRIELINTAAYHHLLPLVPRDAVRRQLRLNLEFYREHLVGNDHVPGVWPPELAVNPEVLETISGIRYAWTIVDDGPFVHSRRHIQENKRVPADWVPVHSSLPARSYENECGLMFRSRRWSEDIVERYENGAQFAQAILAGQNSWRASLGNMGDSYIILARDFETFGHHHRQAIGRFLDPFFDEMARHAHEACVRPIHEIYLASPKLRVAGSAYAGSWSTWPKDIDRGIPYPLWNYPDNSFHRAWNEFIRVAYQVSAMRVTDNRFAELFDKAFYSCSPWQYSHGNKEVARWCLPMFEQIVKLLPDPKLKALYDEMDRLTK